jgi:selenocysteine lyase/cysteine desulfurase
MESGTRLKRRSKAMDFDAVREEFPITKEWLYFDAASLTPYCTPVLGALQKFQRERRDRGSLHYDDWCEEIERCRGLAAKLSGANLNEIALTKNTSEGINLATLIIDWKPGDNVVLSDLDFTTNIYPFQNLKDKGVEVKYIKSEEGMVLPEDVEREIDDNTKLVSLSNVLYRNGYRIDVEKIGAICREREVLFNVDATQALGALPVDVKKANVDFLSVTGFKWLLSPFGSGFCYIKEEFLECSPIIGWRSVENPFALDAHNYTILDSAKRFETGTLDLGAFIGMNAALDLIESIGAGKIEKRIIELSSHLTSELNDAGLDVLSNFDEANRSGIVSFDNFGITREDLIKHKIIATARDYVRLSPHIYNTKDEISEAVEIIRVLRR